MKIVIYILVSGLALLIIQCSDLKGTSLSSPENFDGKENETKLKEHLSDERSTYRDIINDIQLMTDETNKIKNIEDFLFEADYQPHLLLTLINQDSLKPDALIDKKVLAKADEYNKLHYIKFSIENKNFKSELLRYNAETPDEYSQRISYYSFQVKNDVYLVENSTDTLRGAFVNFERTFDMSPKLNMTFVFERKKTTALKNITFVYEDVVFNSGKLNFEFDYNKIEYLNAPYIKK